MGPKQLSDSVFIINLYFQRKRTFQAFNVVSNAASFDGVITANILAIARVTDNVAAHDVPVASTDGVDPGYLLLLAFS